jgi:protein gp37
MSDTKISWTGKTWNPVTGCDRISPGCDNCYALTLAGRLKRMGQPKYQADGDPRTSGPGFGVTCHPDVLDEPLRWRKPQLVFPCSMSDLFHQEVPEQFILRVFDVMRRTPQHTYQVLTKRPQRMAELLPRTAWRKPTAAEVAVGFTGTDGIIGYQWSGAPGDRYDTCGVPLPNVHLGTTIESDRYTFRADHLRATPAAVRWLSLEPLIGPLPSLSFEGVDWVVIGGESGHGARPMELEWAADLADRAKDAGCKVHVKQLGTVLGKQLGIGHHDFDNFPVEVKIRETI